jgi:hypothetical protein
MIKLSLVLIILFTQLSFAEIKIIQKTPDWVHFLRSGESRLKLKSGNKYLFRSIVKSSKLSSDGLCQKALDRNVEFIKKNYPYAEQIPMTVELVFYDPKFKDCSTTISIRTNIIQKIEAITAIKKNYKKTIKGLNANYQKVINKLERDKKTIQDKLGLDKKKLQKKIKKQELRLQKEKKGAGNKTLRLLKVLNVLQNKIAVLEGQLDLSQRAKLKISELDKQVKGMSNGLSKHVSAAERRILLKSSKIKSRKKLSKLGYKRARGNFLEQFKHLIHGLKKSEVKKILNMTKDWHHSSSNFFGEEARSSGCSPKNHPSYKIQAVGIEIDGRDDYPYPKTRLDKFLLFGYSVELEEDDVLLAVCSAKWKPSDYVCPGYRSHWCSPRSTPCSIKRAGGSIYYFTESQNCSEILLDSFK